MRKIRFFFRYQLILAGTLLVTATLDQAALACLKEKEEYFRLMEESGKEAELKEPRYMDQKIRVLLMTTDYQSYFHPSVTVVRNGKEHIYTQETFKVSGEKIKIPAHKDGLRVSSVPVSYTHLDVYKRQDHTDLNRSILHL